MSQSKLIEPLVFLVVVALGLLTLQDCAMRQPPSTPPIWVVPGAAVKHKSGSSGIIKSFANGRVEVETDGGRIICEPIDIIPLR